MEVIIPVGPNDNLEWVKKSVSSALSQKFNRVIIYDNSERKDIEEYFRTLSSEIVYIKDKRMNKVNMAKLRNKMLELASEKYVAFLDSDVVLPNDFIKKVEEKLSQGVTFTWMHYAYSEEEINKPLAKGENNPNLGCSALDIEEIRKIGGFDEKYERDEDVWLYAKLRKLGYRAEPTEGRCLHLNKIHARLDFKSSIKEAKRNLWRSKYDIMLIFDGLTDITFLTGYAYYGSYYLLGVLSPFFPLLSALYMPLIAIGVYYYRGFKKYFLNLIPGLTLAISLPYGLFYNLTKGKKKGNVDLTKL
ncbi:MAG: glycosyltransferase family A protein [Sulfolobaceae archaeon]